jgi:hypothetical protein
MIKQSLFVPTTAVLCSPFDAEAFMSQSQEGGALDTTIPMPPEGDYRAMIGDFNSENGFRSFTSNDPNKQSYGKEFTMFQPPFVLQDDPRLSEVSAFYGGKPVVVRHAGMFLDLANGGLDMGKGKNVDLGKLLDAVGQNPMPQGWKFTNLIGAGPVMVKVSHEKDRNDSTKSYARVSRVVKLS